MIRRIASTFMALFGLFKLVADVQFVGAQQDLPQTRQELVEAIRMPLRHIRSIEFVASRRSRLQLPPNSLDLPAVQNTTNRYQLVCDGNLFRLDCFDGSGSSIESIAHDGRKYQLFDTQLKLYSESLEVGLAPQAPFYSPILWAYAWLFDGESPQTVEYLLSPTPWEELASQLEITDRPNLGSGTLFVAEIIRSRASGLDLLFRIEFSPEQNWLPMRWQSFRLPKRELSTTFEVMDVATVLLDEGLEIGIPLEVSVTSPQITGIYSLEEASLRVNHRVDRDIFSLSSAQADFVSNRIEEHSSVAEAIDTRELWGQRRIAWALAATLALLIAGIVLWRARRRSR